MAYIGLVYFLLPSDVSCMSRASQVPLKGPSVFQAFSAPACPLRRCGFRSLSQKLQAKDAPQPTRIKEENSHRGLPHIFVSIHPSIDFLKLRLQAQGSEQRKTGHQLSTDVFVRELKYNIIHREQAPPPRSPTSWGPCRHGQGPLTMLMHLWLCLRAIYLTL